MKRKKSKKRSLQNKRKAVCEDEKGPCKKHKEHDASETRNRVPSFLSFVVCVLCLFVF